MVIAFVEKNADETYTLKPLKQKLFVDGLCYLLQEIYGIENKNVTTSKVSFHFINCNESKKFFVYFFVFEFVLNYL